MISANCPTLEVQDFVLALNLKCANFCGAGNLGELEDVLALSFLQPMELHAHKIKSATVDSV
jgi:hypothetical protein